MKLSCYHLFLSRLIYIISLCLAWSATKQTSDIFLLLLTNPAFCLDPYAVSSLVQKFLNCSRLCLHMAPFLCILSVIWLVLLSRKSFLFKKKKTYFFADCSDFTFMNLNNSLFILHGCHFLSFISISLFFLQCGSTSQDCLPHIHQYSKVSVLISTFSKGISVMWLHPYFSCNSFLFHLTPFSSLPILLSHHSHFPYATSSYFILSQEFLKHLSCFLE